MNGTFEYWPSNLESLSTIIRNFGLVLAAGIALWFAWMRIVVADRQADTAQDQSETARLGLLNERYKKGVEMLANEHLLIRRGGFHALECLASDDPEQYHLRVMHLFCDFVREPVGKAVEAALPINGLTPDAIFKSGWDQPEADDEDSTDRSLRVREDVQAVIDVIRKRSEECIALEAKAKFRLNLHGADLRFANLSEIILDGAFLVETDLSNAILFGASLLGADLSGALLDGANLSGTHFSRPDAPRSATCLTQAQLDQASAEIHNRPHLGGILDPKGKSLVWHDRWHRSD